MRRTLTISAHKRPGHLRQVLEALRQCDGLQNWISPIVVCDHHKLQDANVEVARDLGFSTVTYGANIGCNRMIRSCFDHGIHHVRSDFHVHLEDDTVPTKGCLRWFEWASENLHHPSVASVLAYSRFPIGTASEYRLQQQDLSWGWGTWHSTWNTFFAPNWSPVGREFPAWDSHIQQLLGTRMVAQPCISRIQNIGRENGTYCLDDRTYEEQHRSRLTTDEIVREFSLKDDGSHPSKAA
jgi:hypothetical protein